MTIEDLYNVNLLLNYMPESMRLLIFGAGLVGATFVLRRWFKRADAEKAARSFSEK